MSCERWRLRPATASWWYDWPSTGSSAPAASAHAVQLASGDELRRADDPELGPELGADEVLPAFAPAERQVRNLGAHAPGEQCEQVRVLVVGVRADHQHALVGAELPQGAGQRRDAAGAGRGQLAEARAGGADTQDETVR